MGRIFGTGASGGSERHMIIVPDNYGGNGYLALVAHGLLSDGWTYSPKAYREDLEILADTGIVVLSADFGGLATWSNDDWLDGVSTAITFMSDNFDVRTDKLVGIGDSMGGGGIANWAWRNPSQVGAIVLRVPAVAMDALHDRDAVIGDSMEAAYGGASQYEAAVPNRDPSHADNLAQIDPISGKFLIYYSDNDPTVLRSDVLTFKGATGITAISLGAAQHDPDLIYSAINGSAQASWIWRTLGV